MQSDNTYIISIHALFFPHSNHLSISYFSPQLQTVESSLLILRSPSLSEQLHMYSSKIHPPWKYIYISFCAACDPNMRFCMPEWYIMIFAVLSGVHVIIETSVNEKKKKKKKNIIRLCY
jgi:hypothetical protein